MNNSNNDKGQKPFKAKKTSTNAPKIYKPKGKKPTDKPLGKEERAEIITESKKTQSPNKKSKIADKNKGFPKRYAKADRNNEPPVATPLTTKKEWIKKEKVTPNRTIIKTETDTQKPNPKHNNQFHFEPEVEAPHTLNKYVAHAGVCGRREAAALIKAGKVTVNGKKEENPAYRVQEKDKVLLAGKQLFSQKNLVYVLLNKPKDFITSTEDEKGRRTVMDLIATASDTRLYPVGRLDRNTTGVMLLTNDGDLAQRLMHPKFNVQKIYQATLDKDLTKAHFDKILSGTKLEDGEIKADELSYLTTKKEIGIEIHSGKNRVVRRIFESLGYAVLKLDRVLFAGLTKKNVARGKWRYLSPKEVTLLKHFKQ